jgi:hypothetical protein
MGKFAEVFGKVSQRWESSPKRSGRFPINGKVCRSVREGFPTMGKFAEAFGKVSRRWESSPKRSGRFPVDGMAGGGEGEKKKAPGEGRLVVVARRVVVGWVAAARGC